MIRKGLLPVKLGVVFLEVGVDVGWCHFEDGEAGEAGEAVTVSLTWSAYIVVEKRVCLC